MPAGARRQGIQAAPRGPRVEVGRVLGSRRRESRASGSARPGTERKNARLFCDLLELLDTRYGPGVRRIHLILDNYGIHSEHATLRTLEALEGRIVLHFLPPYCPDANRIERVSQDFHANVTCNHRCKMMRRLLDNAREYLDHYLWRRVTGAAPIIQRAA
jgi:hypothetical protein